MTTSPGTQRDELARDIFFADNANAPKDRIQQDWEALGRSTQAGKTYAYAIADGLAVKGYRKPRTITTVEELTLLPGGATIRDRHGVMWQRYLKVMSAPVWFPATRDNGFYYDSNMEDSGRLPATVLWEPEA